MDDRDISVPDSRDVSEVLQTDPLYYALGIWLTNPFVLGVVVALLAILMIVFGPSTGSRFIYTDF